jgi:hypothetical protein
MREKMRDECSAAVETLDRVLEERPKQIQEDMIEATRRLVLLRDDLIEQRRAGDLSREELDWLDHVNGVISVVVGGQYPLVGVRWERVKHARDALAELLKPGRPTVLDDTEPPPV